MMSSTAMNVPTLLLSALFVAAVLFSPICPVQVEKVKDTKPCPAPAQCRTRAEYGQFDAPILVAASGLTWSVDTSDSDADTAYSFSANPFVVAALLSLAIIVPFSLLVMARRRRGLRFVTLKRRHWRVFLWSFGFYVIVLSAYWALNYMLFYGDPFSEVERTAFIDPLLTSIVVTLLLLGSGLLVMMLAVRSRTIWPVEGGTGPREPGQTF